MCLQRMTTPNQHETPGNTTISSLASKVVDSFVEGKKSIDIEQFVEPFVKAPYELEQEKGRDRLYFLMDAKLREAIGWVEQDEGSGKWYIYPDNRHNIYVRGADYKQTFDSKEAAAHYLWKAWLRHIGGKENHVDWMERKRRFQNYPYEQPPLGECLIAMNTSAEVIASKLLAKPRRTVKPKPKADITAPNYSGGMGALPTTI